MIEPGKIIVLGDGGHASSVAEASDAAGFTVLELLSIARDDDSLAKLQRQVESFDLTVVSMALGVGENFFRATVYQTIIGTFANAKFPPVVHPAAWISPTASMSAGSVVLSQCSVGSGAKLGLGSLLNTGASVDHHGTLGEFSSLGPGARTGGNVTIGPRTMIGLQAGILQGLTVHNDTVIGAQSLVVEDIPAQCVGIGSPCKVVRARAPHDKVY